MIRLQSASTPGNSSSGEFSTDMVWFLTNSDDELDFSAESQIGEERVKEVMQELYQEIITCSSCVDTHPPPPPPPISFPSPPSSAVVGLHGESCGAALSATASSVMAGIKFVASASTGMSKAKKAERTVVNGGGGDLRVETTAMRMDGCDGLDADGDESDPWLTSVLGRDPMDLEEE